MQYFISFLEGIITFISPCLLPMIPIYISYFAGGGARSTRRTLTTALGFALGFTVVFVAMGALAGTVGSFLRDHQTAVNVVSGLVVIFFGLHFLGLIKVDLFRGRRRSIRSIAEQNGGLCVFEAESGLFTLRVALPDVSCETL